MFKKRKKNKYEISDSRIDALIIDIKRYIKENYSDESPEIDMWSDDFDWSQCKNSDFNFDYESNIPGSYGYGYDISSVRKMIQENKKNKFQWILNDFIQEQLNNGIIEKDADIYRDTIVSRSVFNKAINGKNIPTKKTVIAIAIGLKLDLYDTERLLNAAGYCLSESNETELVLRYCFENKIYNTLEIDNILDALDLDAFFSYK